ncbi:BZ3500_MvSof-1268-A1-R1_Chr8-1g09730 [Microbotryum saponariae]|uniref:BZ3500_MvSof-1268-A1-R1_Chr8-1g09730 protein n=1 Tax=Microbotryum saponariae TaxID=289078 RepID=A0A2X0KTN6_9BASI|nr:BZ3500_MvSof-1268-A1-R1_Chr8-1g09730 [Microbotryum saponariae]SDA08016.1 BZ3501_MvSof-1269-A2-R1_Chr8-1g09453 [Microbotryum saponariae]
MTDSPTWAYSTKIDVQSSTHPFDTSLGGAVGSSNDEKMIAPSPSIGADIDDFGRSLLMDADTPFRTSIQRAQDVLRESRRTRLDEQKRVYRFEPSRAPSQATLHHDQFAMTRKWANDPTFTRRAGQGGGHHRVMDSIDSGLHGDESGEDGSNDERPRCLHKSRSIPLNLMTSPPHAARIGSERLHDSRFDAPVVNLASISPPKRLGPRKSASYGDLLTSPHRRLDELPQMLEVPNEPMSKFSASSAESRARPLVGETLLSRGARSFGQATSIRNIMARRAAIKSSIPTRSSTIAFGTKWTGRLAAVTESTPSQKAHGSVSSAKLSQGRNQASAKTRPSLASAGFYNTESSEPSVASRASFSRLQGSRIPARLKSFAFNGARSSEAASLCSPVSSSATESSSSPFSKRESHLSASSKESSVKRTFSKLFNRSMRRGALTSTPRDDANDAFANAVVHRAEKVRVPEDLTGAIQVDSTALPTRIPISSIFPNATLRPNSTSGIIPIRPQRPITPDIEPYAATFGGQVLVGKDSTARRRSSITRRRRSLIPVPSGRRSSAPQPIVAVSRQDGVTQIVEVDLKGRGEVEHVSAVSDSADSLPPSAPSPEPRPTSATLTVSDSDPDATTLLDSSASNRSARSFRSPSPARFRDLLPSETASSSPVKSERGLPLPAHRGLDVLIASPPKKRAMGPEQVIVMEHAPATEGIRETRGATTDLAELLSSLDDTEDVSVRVAPTLSPDEKYDGDLSASLRRHLPIVIRAPGLGSLGSLESLDPIVADVPDDLQTLIQSVTEHISEIDVGVYGPAEEPNQIHVPEFGIIGTFDAVRYAPQAGSRDSAIGQPNPFDEIEGRASASNSLRSCKLDDAVELAEVPESDHSSSDGEDEVVEGPSFIALGTRTMDHMLNTDSERSDEAKFCNVPNLRADASPNSTDSSFSGRVTTAGAVLQAMLLRGKLSVSSSPDSPVDRLPKLRESLEDYLTMERPTVGEKMLDSLDVELSLTSLIAATSPPPSVERDLVGRSMTRTLGSLAPSEDGSNEGEPLEGVSASPSPASRRKPLNNLRQSLVRYSQDRARSVLVLGGRSIESAFAEVDESSESEFGQRDSGSSNGPDQTNHSMAQSSRSTNLSISSITSSPCPVPRSRRIPMLTKHSPPLAPAFEFPSSVSASSVGKRDLATSATVSNFGDRSRSLSPVKKVDPFSKQFSPLERFNARRRGESTKEDEEVAAQVSSRSSSPRCIRDLRSRPSEHDEEQAPTSIADEVSPPSSPSSEPSESDHDPRSSIGSFASTTQFQLDDERTRPSSLDLAQLEIDYHSRPPMVTIRAKSINQSTNRQSLRASTFIQETIVEDDRETWSSSVETSPVKKAVESKIEDSVKDVEVEAKRLEEELKYRLSLAPTTATDGIARTLIDGVVESSGRAPIIIPVLDVDVGPTFENVLGEAQQDHVLADEQEEEEEEEEEEPYIRRREWVHYIYEAEDELRRSRSRWIDTDRSRDALTNFKLPIGMQAIFDFLHASRIRYRAGTDRYSRTSSMLDSTPSPSLSPSDAKNPSPILSPGFESSSPVEKIVQQRDEVGFDTNSLTNKTIKVTTMTTNTKRKPVPVFAVLRDSGKEKIEDRSPFTALPPRLALRKRRPSVLSQAVDVSFLNGQLKELAQKSGKVVGQGEEDDEDYATITTRQDQFDLTRRKLEGIKEVGKLRVKKEQVILEAQGLVDQNQVDLFPKTPRLSTSRPRVRARKTVLSSLR